MYQKLFMKGFFPYLLLLHPVLPGILKKPHSLKRKWGLNSSSIHITILIYIYLLHTFIIIAFITATNSFPSSNFNVVDDSIVSS